MTRVGADVTLSGFALVLVGVGVGAGLLARLLHRPAADWPLLKLRIVGLAIVSVGIGVGIVGRV